MLEMIWKGFLFVAVGLIGMLVCGSFFLPLALCCERQGFIPLLMYLPLCIIDGGALELAGYLLSKLK